MQLNRRDFLKIVALVSMLIDHTSIFFGDMIAIRAVGRMAFPIYCYLLYDGWQRTSDRNKYADRLAFMAVLAQYPFIRLFPSEAYNVGVTLLFGFVGLSSPIAGLILAGVAKRVNTDYNAIGVITILLMRIHYSVGVGFLALHYLIHFNYIYPVVTLLVIPLIWWCRRDTSEFKGNKVLRRIWYLAYPAHLLLYLILSGR